MRLLVALHRWLGLGTAAFLFLAGLTGAIIAWDHELDELLNNAMYSVEAGGRTPLTPMELAARVEAAEPKARISYVTLSTEADHALLMSVSPKVDVATEQPYKLDYDQVAVNPYTGEIQGRRMWGAFALRRDALIPFLYRLHYSLQLPMVGGIESGVLLMGIIGIAWVVDCFVSLWIAFPNRKVWRRSFAFRWREGGARLNFDLHRSGGVWAWLFLLVLAITSVSMNLGTQVVRPVVALFSPLTPRVFDKPALPDPVEPTLERAAVLKVAEAEANRRGWTKPPGGVFYSPPWGVYGVGFFSPGHEHGDMGLGNPWLYFDGRTGMLVSEDVPGEGSVGDLFMQLQFPLHSGRIVGLPGRIAVTIVGLVVAMLSATGVILWAKRRVRKAAAA